MFWPPAVLLIVALAYSLADFDGFHAAAAAANRWILSRFDWAFSLMAFIAVIFLAWVAISPLGAVRLGGPDARPILSRWSWFSITLCTTVAIGILFWGAAEPIFHVNDPPDFAGAAARSEAASVFAVSTLFMHWTLTPYALYSATALAFALAHFNLHRPYSLAGPLSVIAGRAATGRAGAILDAVGLFALVAGVAGALGVGVMTLSGGFERLFGIADGPLLRLVITLTIVAAFVASSVSGLQRGIRFLSDINVKAFAAITLFVFVFGPTAEIVSLGLRSVAAYLRDFVPASLALGARAGDEWTRDWTVFNFANWLAWAPITAMFLGRIAYGYTVREFLLFNMIAPAGFSAVWMSVFGGAAIAIDASSGGVLTAALEAGGPDAVIYALFDAFPLAGFVIVAFIFLTFISFVTAMDSNTHSIASVCLPTSDDDRLDRQRSFPVKVFWGVLVGAVAWVMTATTGIDGVRMLSNLGGLPGLAILTGSIATIIAIRRGWLDEVRAARQPAPARASFSEEEIGKVSR